MSRSLSFGVSDDLRELQAPGGKHDHPKQNPPVTPAVLIAET